MPSFLDEELGHRPRPQCAAKQRKQEGSVLSQPFHVPGKTLAIACGEPVEGRDIERTVAPKNKAFATWEQNAGWNFRMSECQPAFFQFGAQHRIGRRKQEEHECRRHDIMLETWRRYLFGADAAADAVIAFKYEHLLAAQTQHARSHQRIDATAGDYIVVHRPS